MHSSLVEARHILRRAMPFLSHALWSLSFVEVPGMARLMAKQTGGMMTAYISCDKFWRVYYDPEVIPTVDTRFLAFDLYHELCHLLRKHGERFEKMKLDPLIYNIASDLSINGDAREIASTTGGLVRPSEGIVLPDHFDLPCGKSAEWYYEKLLELRDEGGDGGGAVGGSRKGQQGPKSGKEGGPSGSGHGHCGGCAGNPNPWENNASPEGSGDGMPRGLAPTEARMVAVQVAYAAKRQGNAPAGWKRWADEVLEPPRVDPRMLFKHTVSSRLGQIAGKLDYTYAYPSRRQFVAPQVILPGMYAPQIRLAVVIDTSGSISNKELAYELAFVKEAIKSAFIHETYVYSCDYAANLAGKAFTQSDIRRLDIRGGGGTSMRNGVLKAQECRPSLIIVLTDGYTDWPSPEELKGIPVIWGLVGKSPPTPPEGIGDVIHLTAEAA